MHTLLEECKEAGDGENAGHPVCCQGSACGNDACVLRPSVLCLKNWLGALDALDATLGAIHLIGPQEACSPMFSVCPLLCSVYGIFGLTVCVYWFFSAKLLDRLSKVGPGHVSAHEYLHT